MSELLVALAAWLTVAAALSVILGASYPLLHRPLQRIAPAQRADLLLAASLLPMALSLTWIVFVFTPTAGAWLVDAHCHEQAACGAHAPVVFVRSDIQLTSFLAGSGALLCIVAAVAWRWRRALHQSNLVSRLAHHSGNGYSVADTAEPIAVSIGWLRPYIVVSQGLLEIATPDDLAVILAHEETHGRRRDNLRHLVAAAATVLVPRRRRELLLSDLRAAAEQACDASAAGRVQDRLQVAQTVLKFAGLALPSRTLRMCAFGESAAVARVRALLHPEKHRLARSLRTLMGLTLAIIGLMGAAPLHHVIEALLRR